MRNRTRATCVMIELTNRVAVLELITIVQPRSGLRRWCDASPLMRERFVGNLPKWVVSAIKCTNGGFPFRMYSEVAKLAASASRRLKSPVSTVLTTRLSTYQDTSYGISISFWPSSAQDELGNI